MSHYVLAHSVIAIERLSWAQTSLCIHAKNDNVIQRCVFHDRVHVVHTFLVRYSIAAGFRVATNDPNLPATPLEIRSKRTPMVHERDLLNTKTFIKNQCTCPPM
jgi:hypothetical protein